MQNRQTEIFSHGSQSFRLTLPPDSVINMLGDFNRCSLTFLRFHQSVTVPTRDDKTIDIVFCNVKDVFLLVQKPCIHG